MELKYKVYCGIMITIIVLVFGYIGIAQHDCSRQGGVMLRSWLGSMHCYDEKSLRRIGG